MLDTIKKMFRNKIFYCFLILIVIMFPQTFYMQSDNNTKLVVTTIGIDKSENGFKLSTLAVIPKVSNDVNANLEVFEGEGKSISEALENISLNTGKSVGLAHCDCIILSMDILNDNMTSVLDFFIRTSNLTTNAAILGTSNESKKLVEVSKNSNNLLDLSLKDIVTYQENISLLENTTIEKFYRSYFSKSGTFFMPIIDVQSDEEKSQSQSNSSNSNDSSGADSESGSSSKEQSKIKNNQDVAVIKNGKFERILTQDELFIYNLLSKSSENLQLTIEDINDEYVNNSIEIYQQVSKVRLPLYKYDESGNPYVQYEVWLNIMLDEINSRNNFAYASIDSLQNYLSNTVEKEIYKLIDEKRKSTVATIRQENSDILEIYKKFNAYSYTKWHNYLKTLDNQENYLQNVDIKINVHLNYVI